MAKHSWGQNQATPKNLGNLTIFCNASIRIVTKWKPLVLIGSIGLVVSVLMNIAQMYDWFYEPGPKIIVAANESTFLFPPNPVLEVMGLPKIDTFEAMNEISRCLTLQIKNVGDLDAKNVMLQLNDSGFACVVWDDEKTDASEFKTRIELGDILSKQSLVVFIWGRKGSYEDDSLPTLTHNAGAYKIHKPWELRQRDALVLPVLFVFMYLYVWGFSRFRKAVIALTKSNETMSHAVSEISDIRSDIQKANSKTP